MHYGLMPVMHALNPVSWLIIKVLDLYSLVIWAWFILSWLKVFNIVNRYQPVVQKLDYALSKLTEPVLRRIRKYMPNLGGIDISPIILIIAINFIEQVVLYYS